MRTSSPTETLHAADAPAPVIEVLARHATRIRRTAMDKDVLHHAKRAVIDWYAALHAGFDEPAVRSIEAALAEDLGHGRASLVRGIPATPRAAALIHGTAAHAAEADDTFRDAMFHPGAPTIAAALAAGQASNANGLEFLSAVVLGYEISIRIAITMGRPHAEYWHGTGTIGCFGAAAAAASLLDLDEPRFAHALATAATFAAGLQQAFLSETMVKAVHAGRAAEAGLLAAQLAGAGLRCSLTVLDGAAGLGVAMGDSPDWSQVGATLGQRFHITRLTFKNHIGCGHTFPAIDGALELQRRHGFRVADIEQLHIATYEPALEIAGHVNPRSAAEARFSLHYLVASALVHGRVRMAAYQQERIEDPATRALMSRITAGLDTEIDARFPGERAARIEITLRDGRRLIHLQPYRKGDPELPLSDAELGDKLIELAAPAIGDAAAGDLLHTLWNLEACERLPGKIAL
jgi:2-methylcitrate dehydratase PrpD